MSFGTRLRERREELGLKQSELGEMLGITGSAIGNYENGISSPKADILYRVFDVLKCDANYLFQDEMTELNTNDFTVPEIKLLKKYRMLDERGKALVESMIIEEYNFITSNSSDIVASPEDSQIEYIRHYFVPAAAGYSSPIEGEDYELIRRDENTPPDADFCISIDGDSMEPYIHDRELVYVQSNTSLKDFDVGIFFVDGDVLCKQYCVDNFNNLYLLSANPNRQDANKVILSSSGQNVFCCGKVLLSKKLPRPEYY